MQFQVVKYDLKNRDLKSFATDVAAVETARRMFRSIVYISPDHHTTTLQTELARESQINTSDHPQYGEASTECWAVTESAIFPSDMKLPCCSPLLVKNRDLERW